MENERTDAFPASLETAWGLRERPHKGPKRGLTLDSIVAAAVRVADEKGIDAVSMGRVAKELEVSTMALYRYVATKDELVALMVDAALGPPPPLPEGVGWRAGLEHWAAAMREALLAHPWAALLVAAKVPPATPNQLAWLDHGLLALRGTGLREAEKVATALLVSGQVRNEVNILVTLQADPTAEHVVAGYGEFLRRVTADGRLPALRAALEGGAFDDTPTWTAKDATDFDDFAFGLQRVLDGIEAFIKTRAG
jgi:AcrR family transcriptional regulator